MDSLIGHWEKVNTSLFTECDAEKTKLEMHRL